MLDRQLGFTRRALALAAVTSFLACTDSSGPKGPDNSVATIEVSAPIVPLLVAETFQAAAVTKTSGGTATAAAAPVWKSSNIAIATVSANGLVTATGVGTTQISAETEGKKGEFTLKVVAMEIIQSVDQYSG
ncbi:MAG TPA: Ig-like domain-containing protein, partial [Gemmatimonadaceae bacterium]|nr:Ig-like domain-containing protein [Gemmatimonadaceae bacterium]